MESLTGNCVQDRAALMELADIAGTNEDVLRAVVDSFPRLAGIPPEVLPEAQRIRSELVLRLSPCVPGLIGILEEFANGIDRENERDDDRQRRAEFAAEILGEIGEPARAATAAIIRAMHANPRGVGEFAGGSLGKIGGEEAIRELNRIWFSGWDRKLCGSCHWGLAKLGQRAHSTLLLILAEDDEVESARALLSLRAAGYADNDLFALALKSIGTDSSTAVQETAITILEDVHDAAQTELALATLREICKDETHYFDRTRSLAAKVMDGIIRQQAMRY